MAGTILEKRELYIDVAVNENQLQEIFLYRVDFFRDRTFRSKEFLYLKDNAAVQGNIETERTDLTEEELIKAQEEQKLTDPLEMFREQWETYCQDEVPTEVFATDAASVMKHVFEPLAQKYKEFRMTPPVGYGREFMHDCMSMGRVISMSAFDEEQHLSANIRRRIKERYHEYVDDIKAERKEHVFIRQAVSDGMPMIMVNVTDCHYKMKKQVMLNRVLKEETIALRMHEILALYPEADILLDTTSPEIYRLFRNIEERSEDKNRILLFSLESMLAALGKTPDTTDMVRCYLSYIKNQEEMRQGTFLPTHLYGIHSFYFPVQISSEKAWKKQFKKNTLWKPEGKEGYRISAEGDLKGKYIIKVGKEQFVMKLRKISLQRYLKKYAVLRLDVENFCYPGEADKNRINKLASVLFVGEKNGPDVMELKIKDGKQAYSLTAVSREGNETQLWLNGLLKLGKKKQKSDKKALVLSAMNEQAYCVENHGVREEEWMVQNALIRDGVFRKIENALARALKPESKDRQAGVLLKRQKREVKELFDMYRYMVVSFGENYEASQQEEQEQLWKCTEAALDTLSVTQRLDRKFGLFF